MRRASGSEGNSGTASQPPNRRASHALSSCTAAVGRRGEARRGEARRGEARRGDRSACGACVGGCVCVCLIAALSLRIVARQALFIAERSDHSAGFESHQQRPPPVHSNQRTSASTRHARLVCTPRHATPCSRNTTCDGSRRDTRPQRSPLSSSRSRRRCRPRARCYWLQTPGPRPTTHPQAHSRTSRRCTAEPSAPTCPACRCCSRSAARAEDRAGRPPRGRSSIPRPISRRHSRRETTPAPQAAHPRPRRRTRTSRRRKAADRVGAIRAPAPGRAAPPRLRTRPQPTAAVQAVLAD